MIPDHRRRGRHWLSSYPDFQPNPLGRMKRERRRLQRMGNYPLHGRQECARRRRQIAAGRLTAHPVPRG